MADVANRFQMLDEKCESVDELPVPIDMADTIAAAVQAAFDEEILGNRPAKGGGKTRGNSAASAAAKVDGAMIGEIMAQLVTTMQPVLIKAITVAVCASTKQIVTDIMKETAKETHVLKKEVNELKRVIQVQRFDLDRLEQYGRRETIRINGIPETEGGDTNDIVKQLAADIGVSITTADISVSHRMPGRPGTAKTIIAKFVRRDVKASVMRNKRKLRENDKRRGVYVNEDLTPLRAKLSKVLRSDPAIKKVWSIDGRIFCVINEDGRETKKTIETPDDLFKLGWTEERVAELNLYTKY